MKNDMEFCDVCHEEVGFCECPEWTTRQEKSLTRIIEMMVDMEARLDEIEDRLNERD